MRARIGRKRRQNSNSSVPCRVRLGQPLPPEQMIGFSFWEGAIARVRPVCVARLGLTIGHANGMVRMARSPKPPDMRNYRIFEQSAPEGSTASTQRRYVEVGRTSSLLYALHARCVPVQVSGTLAYHPRASP